jgi:phosphoribosylaminoimidazole-succinocarboxamide synthase
MVFKTNLDLPLFYRGKVRDVYDLDTMFLFIATDRLSAFDVIFNETIPGKGKLLTQISNFWAKHLNSTNPFHKLGDEFLNDKVKGILLDKDLSERSMLVEKLDMLPVECVVRKHLTGSGWKEYQATGEVCGNKLPEGLHNGSILPELLFTPATKEDLGNHDENISFAKMVNIVGEELANELKHRSLSIFQEAYDFAFSCGLILVDTKFEFGLRKDGTLVLADEILTPDSSRYWDCQQFLECKDGDVPQSYDKQVVRDYVEQLDWNKSPPPPALPNYVIHSTLGRYREIYNRLKEQQTE